jgi:hypothetical protein
MSSGKLICAAFAGPPSPLKPGVPVPATVVIFPNADTLRIRLFILSAITKPPDGLRAIPFGS